VIELTRLHQEQLPLLVTPHQPQMPKPTLAKHHATALAWATLVLAMQVLVALETRVVQQAVAGLLAGLLVAQLVRLAPTGQVLASVELPCTCYASYAQCVTSNHAMHAGLQECTTSAVLRLQQHHQQCGCLWHLWRLWYSEGLRGCW
jgi:hypothetical protein